MWLPRRGNLKGPLKGSQEPLKGFPIRNKYPKRGTNYYTQQVSIANLVATQIQVTPLGVTCIVYYTQQVSIANLVATQILNNFPKLFNILDTGYPSWGNLCRKYILRNKYPKRGTCCYVARSKVPLLLAFRIKFPVEFYSQANPSGLHIQHSLRECQ